MHRKLTTNLASLLLLFFFAVAMRGQTTAAPNELPTDPAYAKQQQPFTFRERMKWLAQSTVGGESLLAGVFTAGYGTALNHPPEYGPHFEGFAQRYGIRMSGVAVSNTMEVGLGALWGEDPHYYRLGSGHPFKARVKSVVLETFYSRKRSGGFSPAYARLIAVPSSNFLSNTWRTDSEADASHAILRTVYGFAGHMTRNAWEEFRPDKKHQPGPE